MAERFQKLYSIPENLYLEDSPVIIQAGALLLDGQTGGVITQLKIKNISPKTIASAKVTIKAYEPNGSLLSDTAFQYLDLNIVPGSDFGKKVPIFLKNREARRIEVAVTEIVFKDDSIWQQEEQQWYTANLKQEQLKTVYKDMETVKQISIDAGKEYLYVPRMEGNLFLCACGEVTLATKCNRCKTNFDEFQDLLNTEKLEAHKKERLEKEAIAAEEKRKEDALAEQKAKKKRVIVISALAAICTIIAIFLIVFNVIIPSNKYNAALKLEKEGKYKEAQEAFEEILNYKDSDEKSKECEELYLGEKYDNADKLRDSGNYVEAINAFQELGAFRDSGNQSRQTKSLYVKQLIEEDRFDEALEYLNENITTSNADVLQKEIIYQKGLAFYNEKDYENANLLFEQIKGYKDADDLYHIHEYVETVVKEATCETDGEIQKKCQCGDIITESIKSTGHEIVEATCTEKSYCKKCGEVFGEALGHDMVKGKCSRCGYSESKPIVFEGVAGSGNGSQPFNKYISIPEGDYRISVTVGESGTQYAPLALFQIPMRDSIINELNYSGINRQATFHSNGEEYYLCIGNGPYRVVIERI